MEKIKIQQLHESVNKANVFRIASIPDSDSYPDLYAYLKQYLNAAPTATVSAEGLDGEG